jgi:hypothetical protein
MCPVGQRELMLVFLVVLSTAVSSEGACGIADKKWHPGWEAQTKDTEDLCQAACGATATCAYYNFWAKDKSCWLANDKAKLNDEAGASSGPKVCPEEETPVKPVPPVTPPGATTAAGSSGSADSSSIPNWLIVVLLLLLCCCCCLLLLGGALGIPFLFPKKKKTKKVIMAQPEPVVVEYPAAQPVQTMSMVARPVQTMQMVPRPVATAAPIMTVAAPMTSSFTTTAVPATSVYPTGGYATAVPATSVYPTGGYAMTPGYSSYGGF